LPFVGTVAGLGVVLDDRAVSSTQDLGIVVRSSDLIVVAEPQPRITVDLQTRANEIGCTFVASRLATFDAGRYRGTSIGLSYGTGWADPGAW
jgi:hypothetical protein